MQVTRNQSPYRYVSQLLTYTADTAPFSLSATISAERAEYGVKVFLYRSGASDSVLVADRQNIVAGDVYLLSGQSNAASYQPTYTYQNEYIRTVGIYTNNTNYDDYNPADTLWGPCGQTGYTSAGVWGTELARQLIETYGIPICVINGSAGGASVEHLNIRNAANPMDLTTNHGKMLYRVTKGGLKGAVKAYFFRQGENETSGNAPAWPTNFEKLYQNVQLDYPEISRFYLFQINLLSGHLEASASMRDYQRRASSIHPLIVSHATVGTIGYDGIHYNVAGYAQTGAQIFKIVARDLYGSTDTAQITSPNVQKVYYRTAARQEIVVQFDEGQKIIWPNDTTVADTYGNPTTHKLTQWLLLDKQPGSVLAGQADGYRVTLSLSGSRTEQKLAYLPPNYPLLDGMGNPLPGYATIFPGPLLKNQRGLGAFSFWDVPINAPMAPLNDFIAQILSTRSVRLTWTDHDSEQSYILERKRPQDASYTRLVQLPAGSTTFVDTNAASAGVYTYRLRAITALAESTADASVTIDCATGSELISVQSGNFSDITTWQCGRVPTVSDRIRIAVGKTVTLTQEASVQSLTLDGTLRFGPGGNLKVVPQ
ncbi:hypothetical protein GCM10028825_01650 [Spirosoma agri]|nr:fibronectin type III domain-containing protein [Spirosoma agri]